MSKIFTIIIFLCTNLSFLQKVSGQVLHTNKIQYAAGDTLFFKFYDANSSSSKSVWAGLYDLEGKLIEQKKYLQENGTVYGNLQIPASLKSPGVQLMLSDNATKPAAQNFIKPFLVEADLQKKVDDNPELKIEATIEGGSLVEGVTNYITVATTSHFDTHQKIQLLIEENNGKAITDTITVIANSAFVFQLKPLLGQQYSAVALFGNNRRLEFKLMQAVSNAASLHTEISNGHLYYLIQKSQLLPYLDNLSLLFIRDGDTLLGQKLSMPNTKAYTGSIPLEKLPQGAFNTLLCDAGGRVMQSKQIINIPDSSLPQVHLNDIGNNQKELIIDDKGRYEFSVSINNDTNELIEEEKKNNGWKIFASSEPQKPGSDSDRLSFKLVPVEKNMKIFMSDSLSVIVKDTIYGMQAFTVYPKTAEEFELKNIACFGRTQLLWKVNGNARLTEGLKIMATDSAMLPNWIPAYILPTFEEKVDSTMAVSLSKSNTPSQSKKFNEEKILDTVKIQNRLSPKRLAKRNVELDEKYATGMFRGQARAYQLNVIDDENVWIYTDIGSYITGKFPSGLKAVGPIGRRVITTPNRGSPIIFIDELPQPYDSYWETINISEIALIKYIPGVVVLPSTVTSDGALYIYTRKPDDIPKYRRNDFKKSLITGYDIPVDFSFNKGLESEEGAHYWIAVDGKITVPLPTSNATKRLIIIYAIDRALNRIVLSKKILLN